MSGVPVPTHGVIHPCCFRFLHLSSTIVARICKTKQDWCYDISRASKGRPKRGAIYDRLQFDNGLSSSNIRARALHWYSHFQCKPRLDTLYPLLSKVHYSAFLISFFALPHSVFIVLSMFRPPPGISCLFAFPGFPKHVHPCLLTLSVAKAMCFTRYPRRMKTFSFPMCPIRSHTRTGMSGLGSTGASGHTIIASLSILFIQCGVLIYLPNVLGLPNFRHVDGGSFMHEPRWFSAEIDDA